MPWATPVDYGSDCRAASVVLNGQQLGDNLGKLEIPEEEAGGQKSVA